MKTRSLMMTVAAVSLLATAPAKAEEMSPSMMDSFVQSLENGMAEIQSWFTPADDSYMDTEMAAGATDMIEIPPQLIEPAAGHADMVDHAAEAASDMADHADHAVEEATDMATDAMPATDAPSTDMMNKAADMADEATTDAATDAMDAATDAATDAADDAMDAVKDAAPDDAGDAVMDAVKEMGDQSMTTTPVDTAPSMERIEANSMKADMPTANDIVAPGMPTTDMATDMAADAMPTPDMPSADVMEEAATQAEEMVEEAAEAAQDSMSQTGSAFQVEESVSAFEDPTMSPEQLNAIQSAAGDAQEAVEGMVSDFANDNLTVE